jgi:hypothetical protein
MNNRKPDINELELILVEYRRGLKTFTEHQCLIKCNVKRAQMSDNHMASPMQLFVVKNALVLTAFQKKIREVKKQLYKLNLQKRGLADVIPSK